MNIKIFSAVAICVVSTQVIANKAYWVDTNGNYVHDRHGHCVRTTWWTQEASIPSCEGVEVVPAEEVEIVEQKSVNISLESGASFELGGSTLSEEGKAEIAVLVTQFEGKTVESVVVEGYTDNSGDAGFNQKLSLERADAVKAELVANGANAEKITTVGYGESKPIADNATSEGRAKNRRVEIKVDGIQQGQL